MPPSLISRNPRERRIGRRALPYMIAFQIALPLAAPLIDLLALYGLLFGNPLHVLAYWRGLNVLQVLLAVFAFRVDREPLRPLWALPLQQFAYRQLMHLVIIESAVTAVAGVRTHWRHLLTGLVTTGEPEANGGRDRFCAIAMAHSEYKKGPSHSSL